MRHTGVAANHYTDGEDDLENFPTRMNASDVAFTTWGTNPANDCFSDESPADVYCTELGNRGAVSEFTDAKGWYPGLEYRPGEGGLFFRDIDASVVIPSKDNQAYSTRLVDKFGNPLTNLYGIEVLPGHKTGSGNPGDEGKQLGVMFTILGTSRGNTYATVHVRPVQ